MNKLFKKFDELLKSAGDKLKGTQSAQPEKKPETNTNESEQVAIHASVTEESEMPKAKPQEISKPQLESKDNLLRSIIATLSRLVEDKEYSKGMRLVLWLNADALTFKNYANDQYRQRIMTALVNERGYYFEDVLFFMGKPAEKLRATRIGENELEYLQVIDNVETPKTISCKASISIFGDAGSLLHEQYTLSSDEMKEKMISAYNIGAGKYPKIPTGYRENHIAIDDNPQSPYVEKNKYVSRMHAHIGFSNTFGFYLQVERDGTKLLGKRTRIFRHDIEKPIECDNPQAKIPLEDGDLIELGKAVVLKYVQINDEKHEQVS